MAVPSVERGRGAWSAVGKDNGSRYYEYIEGKPLDGSSPDRDENYEAVNYGVRAIQSRINAYGFSPKIIVDGVLGKTTRDGIIWVQKRLGLTADGKAGPATCKALWRDLLIWFGGVYHVPASQMYGFMQLESNGDPGALGVTTPADRGLNQISERWHPDITDDKAFDPVYSIDYTAKRLGAARIQFSGKTSDLKNRCAIAQHNNPLAAKQWYEAETPPNEQIATYVDLVLGHALKFR